MTCKVANCIRGNVNTTLWAYAENDNRNEQELAQKSESTHLHSMPMHGEMVAIC